MLRGALELADRWGVAGWAHDGARPAGLPPPDLEVFANGRLAAVVPAGRYRPDLLRAGLGDGACAFEAWFDEALPAGRDAVIAVRLADGRQLPGSPRVLPAERPPPAAQRLPDQGAPLALAIDMAAPEAGRDAGSAALLSHMAALRTLGFAVRFSDLAGAPAVLAQTQGRVRLAYLHRLRPALLAAGLRAGNPGIHIVYSVADLAHLRAGRQAAVLGGIAPPGLRAAELAAARAADAVVTHSPVEAALLAAALPGQRIACVPWAVTPAPVDTAWARRAGIGFIGSYGHAPNLDAAAFLLDRVMPLVWRQAPIACVLAGHGMPPGLRARDSEGGAGRLVRVLEPLPDAAAFWRHIRVSAAPLRFGAGIKGKVLDSLAAGIPCVCSPVAAEGLTLPGALVAAEPAAMAAMLVALHDNDAANATLAAAAQAALPTQDLVVQRLAAALPRSANIAR